MCCVLNVGVCLCVQTHASHMLWETRRGHRICWNCIKGVMASCEPADMDHENGTLS